MDEGKRNKLFGQIAVKLGYLTISDVKDALLKQEADEITGHKKHLGTYFFEDELLTKEQISQILQLQKKYIEKFEQQAAEANSEAIPPSEAPKPLSEKINSPVKTSQINASIGQPTVDPPVTNMPPSTIAKTEVASSEFISSNENVTSESDTSINTTNMLNSSEISQPSTALPENQKDSEPLNSNSATTDNNSKLSPDAKDIVAASITFIKNKTSGIVTDLAPSIKKWSQYATQESQKLFQSAKTFYNSKSSNENEINATDAVAETAEAISNENECASVAHKGDQISSPTLICQECGLQLLGSDKSCPNCACPVEKVSDNNHAECNIELSLIENKYAHSPVVRKKFIIVVGGLLGILILYLFISAYSSDALFQRGKTYYLNAKAGRIFDLVNPEPLSQDEIKEYYRYAVINLVRAARLGNDQAMDLLREMHRNRNEVTSKTLEETELFYNRTIFR